MPRLMARAVPPEIAAVAEARHRQEGVDVILNAAVASVVEINDEVHVLLADGRQLIADAVVVGIGAIPNVELAAAAGLAVDNGIVVDEALITSDPDIFAAGDCCSFPLAVFDGLRMRLESWRCAQDQGTHVAGGLLGDVSPFVSVPWFWSDQYDLTLQIAGLPSLGSTTVRRDLGPDAFLLFHLDAAGRLVAASGIGIGNAVGKDIRLAEMLIAARAHPGVSDLASASIRLKSLLAA
jgi:3-phenylpropionate/trans-cinnamate dioxygenase ferredoxin reductase subunit